MFLSLQIFSIVFVQVDEAEERKFLFATRLSGQVEAVRIIIRQRFRHELTTESRFPHPLTGADEHRSQGVGTTVHLSRPLGSYAQHPAVESVHPYRFRGDAMGEGGDTVDAVPRREFRHISKERVEVGQAFGVEQTEHVLVPTRDACFLCGQTEGVRHSLGDGAEFLFACGTYFRLFRQHIVAELIVLLEESFQLCRERFRFVCRRCFCPCFYTNCVLHLCLFKVSHRPPFLQEIHHFSNHILDSFKGFSAANIMHENADFKYFMRNPHY